MKVIHLLSVSALLTLFGCANQTQPTGGPKDKTPPVLLRSIPEDRQTNINPKEISLEFDELIKLKNAKEQILITPRVVQEYEITSKRNRVYIKFKEPLNDSTTYTLNFREGIQDLTEGNIPSDLQLAFSTGPYLDSLSIQGDVKVLFTNKPAKDISILLYNSNDTLSILNGPPVYLTKTTDKGHYELSNLKSGAYDLYALSDKNKNLMAEVKSEAYGFYPEAIKLDSSISKINIEIQNLDISPLKKLSARQSGTTFEAKYNKFITDYKIETHDSLPLHSNFVDETHKSIQIYNPLNIQDSLQIYLTVNDSINNNQTDTIYLKFEPTLRSPRNFTMDVKLDKIFVTDGLLNGQLTFNKTITQTNGDSIFIYLDSLNIFHFDSTHLKWNKTKDQLTFNYKIDPTLLTTSSSTSSSNKPPSPGTKPPLVKENVEKETKTTAPADKSPQLYIGYSTFVSAENDSSALKTTNLSFTKPELFGIILVEIQTDQTSYSVQLLDSKNNVVQSVESIPKFNFNKVSPGDYRIRVLVDANNNGLWDPGNILTNTPSEPVIFYQSTEGNQTLTIRANWELGPNLIQF
ncbi:MAG TPA: Ig-like domain-containing protein [Fulvivirga sp.]|nr:Ig-like domain-containing protein [Fulvivirga sp.]